MARKLFRKFMPDEAKMRQNRALRLFGSTLLARRLWQLNRHSAAWGAASGLFWAWIALPVQTFGAVATAFLGRGNVPLSMALTWVSNPFTWLPCFWLGYVVGAWLLGVEAMHWADFKKVLAEIMDSGLVEGTRRTGSFLVRFYPMYVGGAIIGLVNGALGYVAVRLLWRWHLVRRWNRRHDTRRKANPALRLTSGFAHLHRLRRRAGHAA